MIKSTNNSNQLIINIKSKNLGRVRSYYFLLLLLILVSPNIFASKLKNTTEVPLTSFAFNCTTPTIAATFLSNGIPQSGTVSVRISSVAAGSTSFTIANANGFSGGLASTVLVSGQTTVSIPIQFDGQSVVGIYPLTVSSPDAATTCTIYVAVNSCSTFNATISAGSTTSFCTGGNVTLTASSGSSYIWNTGETTPSVSKNTSGIYSTTVTASNGCRAVAMQNVTVLSAPTASITTKTTTTLCIGDSAKLVATGGTSYRWNTGETTATVIKKSAGTYVVTVTGSNGCTATASKNVAVKTNCESGLCQGQLGDPSVNITFGTGTRTNLTTAVSGATTTHSYAPTGVIVDGFYAVANNASEAGPWAANVSDRSGNGATGRLMVINADNTPKECFRLPISGLCNNLKYQFSAWIRSISNKPEKPNVTFEIRDAITDSLLAIKGTDDIEYGAWYQHGLLFNTANFTNFTLVLRNNTVGGANGNDLVIDDIQFAYCGPPVVLGMTGGSFNSSTGEGTACIDKPITFTSTVTSGYLIVPQYQWQVSTDNGANWTNIAGATNPTYSFTSSAAFAGKRYRLLVAETGYINVPECRVSSNVILFNLSNGAAAISIDKPSAQICAGDSITLTAAAGTNYLWNTGETTASIIKKAGGSYSVSYKDLTGCDISASRVIVLNQNPTANISTSGLSNLSTGGSATLTASGGATYLWSTGQNTASITITSGGTYSVTVTDANGCRGTTSQSITANNPPTVTTAIAPNASSGVTFNGNVAPNASDIDNNLNPNSFTLIDNPANGTISMSPNGAYTYTPSSNFVGTDSVRYRVCDMSNACTIGTIIFTVKNQAPTLTNATPSVTEDVPLNGTVAANASDVNNNLDPNGFSLVDLPKNGNIIFNPNGTYTYTPNPNFNGKDSATYKVCDIFNLCATATIYFTVNPVNDPPTLTNATPSVTEDTPITGNIAPNASDIDNNLNPNSFTLTDNPANGTITMSPDGKYTYTPNPNFTGKDSVHYKVCDTNNACTTATIIFTVNPVNDAPDAAITAPDLAEDSTATFCGLIKDPDAGDAFTATPCNTPNGTATPKVTNSQLCVTYTPKKDFNGQDTICIIVCDKANACDTVKIPVKVVPRNDAPSVTPNKITVDFNSEATQCFPITDIDAGDTHTSSICGSKSGIVTTEVKNGELCVTYKTNNPTVTKDTVCVNLCDKAGSCVKAFVPIAVNPCNNVNPPTLNCPTRVQVSALGDIVSNSKGFINSAKLADNCSGVNISFDIPTATDDCGTPTVKQTSGTTSGSAFKIGTTALVFEATDSDGKKSNCKVDVVVTPFDFVSIDTMTLCLNEEIAIPAVILDNATYSWAGPNNFKSSAGLLRLNFVSKTQAGVYTLNVTTENDCVFKDSIKFTLRETPKVRDTTFITVSTIELKDDLLKRLSSISGTTVELVNNVKNGTLVLNDNGKFAYTPNADYVGTDMFEYELCYDFCQNTCFTAKAYIQVNEPVQLQATEVITPNGDGINDGLVIEGYDPNMSNNKSEIIIYSQWGEVVYRTTAYKNNWNGTYNNLPLPEGTYYFIFKLTPESTPLKSFITIVR